MKRLLALLCLLTALPASALTLKVMQKVEVDNKGKTGDTKTQTRSLDMLITSLENGTVNATVKYWFFARNMKSGKETVLKRGSKDAALEKNVPTAVQSETVTSTYTEEHVEVEKAKGGNKSGGKNKGSKSTTKKIPASGERITGYAVQVFVGKELAADYYSAPSYKLMVQERGQ